MATTVSPTRDLIVNTLPPIIMILISWFSETWVYLQLLVILYYLVIIPPCSTEPWEKGYIVGFNSTVTVITRIVYIFGGESQTKPSFPMVTGWGGRS